MLTAPSKDHKAFENEDDSYDGDDDDDVDEDEDYYPDDSDADVDSESGDPLMLSEFGENFLKKYFLHMTSAFRLFRDKTSSANEARTSRRNGRETRDLRGKV